MRNDIMKERALQIHERIDEVQSELEADYIDLLVTLVNRVLYLESLVKEEDEARQRLLKF